MLRLSLLVAIRSVPCNLLILRAGRLSRQPCSATPAPLRGKNEWLGVRRPALVSIASTFERRAARDAHSLERERQIPHRLARAGDGNRQLFGDAGSVEI